MSQSANEIAQSLAGAHKRLRSEIRKRVVGQDETLELMMLALLCGGHALLLGVPGAVSYTHLTLPTICSV